MKIDLATEADLPALVADMPQQELLAERLLRQSRGDGQLLVARVNRRPIGMVYLWREPADEPEIREHLPEVPLIMHFEVLKEYRGNGIGTRLLQDAEQRLRDAGHSRVALGVNPKNQDAIRLYVRHGYRQWPHGDVTTDSDEYSIYVKALG
ncbi:GNAT family N-acetyltransferase [Dactylosporangium sp. NBC_01737]|uniref:GNAT family N-acetyltransferase n=1 Tax=Dactylosporangium sp. NBC_01737 TaxID=2975959 RepID=UPI002E14EEFE|nr:GNAT family N-acetyltransferase [Dactylosporangium sp. NBC_01737]